MAATGNVHVSFRREAPLGSVRAASKSSLPIPGSVVYESPSSLTSLSASVSPHQQQQQHPSRLRHVQLPQEAGGGSGSALRSSRAASPPEVIVPPPTSVSERVSRLNRKMEHDLTMENSGLMGFSSVLRNRKASGSASLCTSLILSRPASSVKSDVATCDASTQQQQEQQQPQAQGEEDKKISDGQQDKPANTTVVEVLPVLSAGPTAPETAASNPTVRRRRHNVVELTKVDGAMQSSSNNGISSSGSSNIPTVGGGTMNNGGGPASVTNATRGAVAAATEPEPAHLPAIAQRPQPPAGGAAKAVASRQGAPASAAAAAAGATGATTNVKPRSGSADSAKTGEAAPRTLPFNVRRISAPAVIGKATAAAATAKAVTGPPGRRSGAKTPVEASAAAVVPQAGKLPPLNPRTLAATSTSSSRVTRIDGGSPAEPSPGQTPVAPNAAPTPVAQLRSPQRASALMARDTQGEEEGEAERRNTAAPVNAAAATAIVGGSGQPTTPDAAAASRVSPRSPPQQPSGGASPSAPASLSPPEPAAVATSAADPSTEAVDSAADSATGTQPLPVGGDSAEDSRLSSSLLPAPASARVSPPSPFLVSTAEPSLLSTAALQSDSEATAGEGSAPTQPAPAPTPTAPSRVSTAGTVASPASPPVPADDATKAATAVLAGGQRNAAVPAATPPLSPFAASRIAALPKPTAVPPAIDPRFRSSPQPPRPVSGSASHRSRLTAAASNCPVASLPGPVFTVSPGRARVADSYFMPSLSLNSMKPYAAFASAGWAGNSLDGVRAAASMSSAMSPTGKGKRDTYSPLLNQMSAEGFGEDGYGSGAGHNDDYSALAAAVAQGSSGSSVLKAYDSGSSGRGNGDADYVVGGFSDLRHSSRSSSSVSSIRSTSSDAASALNDDFMFALSSSGSPQRSARTSRTKNAKTTTTTAAAGSKAPQGGAARPQDTRSTVVDSTSLVGLSRSAELHGAVTTSGAPLSPRLSRPLMRWPASAAATVSGSAGSLQLTGLTADKSSSTQVSPRCERRGPQSPAQAGGLRLSATQSLPRPCESASPVGTSDAEGSGAAFAPVASESLSTTQDTGSLVLSFLDASLSGSGAGADSNSDAGEEGMLESLLSHGSAVDLDEQAALDRYNFDSLWSGSDDGDDDQEGSDGGKDDMGGGSGCDGDDADEVYDGNDDGEEAEINRKLKAARSNAEVVSDRATALDVGENRQRRLLPVCDFRHYYVPEGFISESHMSLTYKVRERRTRQHFAATVILHDPGAGSTAEPPASVPGQRGGGGVGGPPPMSLELRRLCAMSLLLRHPNLVQTFDVFCRHPADAAQLDAVVKACAEAGDDDAPSRKAGVEIVPPLTRQPPRSRRAGTGRSVVVGAASPRPPQRSPAPPPPQSQQQRKRLAGPARRGAGGAARLPAVALSAQEEESADSSPKDGAATPHSQGSEQQGGGGLFRRLFSGLLGSANGKGAAARAESSPSASSSSLSLSSPDEVRATGDGGRRNTAGSAGTNSDGYPARPTPTRSGRGTRRGGNALTASALHPPPAAGAAAGPETRPTGIVPTFVWPVDAAVELADRERRVAEMRARHSDADRARLAEQRAKVAHLATLLVTGRVVTVLISEYVKDDSVSDPVPLWEEARRGGGLQATQLAAVARSMAAALHYMHTYGAPRLAIIHGAVEPCNVLVGADGVLKVVNYAGTHWWLMKEGEEAEMRAELRDWVCGSRSLEPAADMYGLGCTLLYLSTGLPLAQARRVFQVSAISSPHDSFLSLMRGLLEEEAGSRMSAEAVLQHPFVGSFAPT